ncbi:MAG: hypothetical protein A2269_01855 [Lentisphaerae bacterium RIFOXYA12_FULL_60_10]|nr:MAG: hypothetical protein A2269_01855 [Lentisphaerae bacterium RIFOXYA12_FULL_60_10]
MMCSNDVQGPVWPRTVIVVHPRERRSKCSVEALRKRDDMVFVTFPDPVTVDLGNYVRLGLEGPELSSADAGRGLLLLDGSWRLAVRMEPFYRQVPVRTLPVIRTAYPRKSSLFADPEAGLATVEALYAAFRILGRPTTGLLDHYRWKDTFLALNCGTLNVERGTSGGRGLWYVES